jgi:hypothetical protein
VPAAPIAVADGVAAPDRERLSGRVAVSIALGITLAQPEPLAGEALSDLAEALDAPLVTSDAALARAPGHSARVEVFAG